MGARSCIAAWLLLVISGMAVLNGYANSAGEPGSVPARWPSASSIARTPGRPVLIMFAHPHCPCTRASVRELARVMSRIRGGVDAHVLLFAPADASPEWSRSGLHREAGGIPGVRTAGDPDGREAGRFGARTSGHVVLYGAGGDLLYSGGITGGRGHEGDNRGASAVVALVKGRRPIPAAGSAPTFGCGILGGGP